MTVLPDDQWRLLVDELAARVAAYTPEWTTSNDSDPGVTLLELFAFLSENLLLRAVRIPERGSSAAARTIAALTTLSPCGGSTGLVRNHYFSGRLLTAEDLETEQRYFLDKHRRHNLSLHGTGIVNGLTVALDSTDGTSITVSPGLAVSPKGDEISVPSPVVCEVEQSTSPCFVALRYVERFVDIGPTITGDPMLGVTRIAEGFVVTFETTISATAVTLARLTRDGNRWCADESFQPARVRTKD